MTVDHERSESPVHYVSIGCSCTVHDARVGALDYQVRQVEEEEGGLV